MKNKYLILADGKSKHTLKWIIGIKSYYDVFLISFNGVDNEYYNHIERSQVIVLNDAVKSTGGNYKLLKELFKIKKCIDEINPDILNAHYLTSYGFLGALLKKYFFNNIFLIQSTIGSDVLVAPKKNIFYKLLSKFALNQANIITSDSYFMSDEINKISSVKVLTFPFGLDEFSINEEKIIKDDKLIFSNRALYDNYNIDEVIYWFATISKNYKLVIANDGINRKKLQKLVNKLGVENRVDFVGFINEEEQKMYYKRAKYYISIPTSDSTSVSVLEALRYACIPILSNIPANREWIIDNYNGYLFSSDLNISDTLILEDNVTHYNQLLILKKAIFKKNILYFINNLDIKTQ